MLTLMASQLKPGNPDIGRDQEPTFNGPPHCGEGGIGSPRRGEDWHS